MSYREPSTQSGEYSHGMVHEFLGAFARSGGDPRLLQLAHENILVMKRLVSCWYAGGTGYNFSPREQKALELFGQERFIHPGLAKLAWKEVEFAEPVIRYTDETLMRCAQENREGDHITDFTHDGFTSPGRDWRLVYISGQSLKSIAERYPGLVDLFLCDVTKEDFAEQRVLPGYYLINYHALCGGGREVRVAHDRLLESLGEKYDRVPAAMLCEAAFSISKAYGGGKAATMSYTGHWGSERCKNGSFVRIAIREESNRGRVDSHVSIHFDARTPGNGRIALNTGQSAFVASHGVCLFRKHDF